MPTELLTKDTPSASSFGAAQWGIFDDNGKQILAIDAVADIDYARDYRISDYPQEEGAFQSYNKVKIPFQAKIGFLIAASRRDFLEAVEKTVLRLDLVTVVTPEVRYDSANLTHYGYRRDARAGVSMIRVEVWAQEVRIVGSTVPSKAQSTNGAKSQENGHVQPVPATEPATDNPALFNSAATPAAAPVTSQGSTTTTSRPPTGLFYNPPLTPPK